MSPHELPCPSCFASPCENTARPPLASLVCTSQRQTCTALADESVAPPTCTPAACTAPPPLLPARCGGGWWLPPADSRAYPCSPHCLPTETAQCPAGPSHTPSPSTALPAAPVRRQTCAPGNGPAPWLRSTTPRQGPDRTCRQSMQMTGSIECVYGGEGGRAF